MNKRKFSIIISRIFDFYISVPIIAVILILKYNIKFSLDNIFLLIFIPLILFLIFIFLEIKKNGIKDIDFDLENSKKVRLISIFSVFTWMLFVAFVFMLEHKNTDFVNILLAFSIILFIAFIITFYWKISFHAIMITSLFISSIILGNIYLELFLFLMIFIVSYSRYILKKHTMGQLVAGVGLVSLVFIIFFLSSLIVLK